MINETETQMDSSQFVPRSSKAKKKYEFQSFDELLQELEHAQNSIMGTNKKRNYV